MEVLKREKGDRSALCGSVLKPETTDGKKGEEKGERERAYSLTSPESFTL